MTLLKATFKKVFNYLISDLTDAFLFCSAPSGPAWLAFLFKPCICLVFPTGKFGDYLFIYLFFLDWIGVI